MLLKSNYHMINYAIFYWIVFKSYIPGTNFVGLKTTGESRVTMLGTLGALDYDRWESSNDVGDTGPKIMTDERRITMLVTWVEKPERMGSEMDNSRTANG